MAAPNYKGTGGGQRDVILRMLWITVGRSGDKWW